MMMQSSHCFFKKSQLVKVCSSYLPEAYADCVAAHEILSANRPTAEKANFESLIGLVFNLLSVKVFDKNRKI